MTITPYCSEGQSLDYLQLEPVWLDASTPDRERLLKQATLVLDSQVQFQGQALSPAQELAFPRTAFRYWEPRLALWKDVPAGDTPELLRRVTAYFALYLLQNPDFLSLESGGASWNSLTVGPISISKGTSISDNRQSKQLPLDFLRLIAPLTTTPGSYTQGHGTSWWRAN